MKTIEEILNTGINNYNRQVNDMSKFSLNDREIKMFSDCMQEYAQQQVELAVDEALKMASNHGKIMHCENDGDPIEVGLDCIGDWKMSIVPKSLAILDTESILSLRPQILENLKINNNGK